jgi:low affinity Fe/Cu permease
MFQRWANVLSKWQVRGALMLIGVVATVALGPMSIFGAYMLVTTPLSDAQDKYMLLGWSLVGTGGVIAIAAAWVRLLVARRHFQERPILKWSTVAGLTIGLAIAVLLLRNPAMAWLVALTIPVGVFLLGATLGETKSRADTSGPEAANSAL